MKFFILLSAGSNKNQPVLNIERFNVVDGKYEFGITEKFLVAYLAGLAWLPKEEYMPFIENAQVGEMTLLKNMIAIVRLRDVMDRVQEELSKIMDEPGRREAAKHVEDALFKKDVTVSGIWDYCKDIEARMIQFIPIETNS